MRELPILFSTPMVRAILDGNKTMTRRIVKPQPPDEAKTLCGPKTYEPIAIDKDGEMYPGSPIYGAYDENGEWGTKCPYQPGDHLWVRETWRCVKYDNMDGDLNYGVEFKDGTRKYFKFDDSERYHQFGKYALKKGWQPSIYLPKEAARIWLEITNVRVERLQEITEEDAMSEGVSWLDDACYANNGWHPTYYDPDSGGGPIFRDGFKSLWDSINAKRGYDWDTNPWVWVISFKKVTP